jgi:hypothetical protein
VDARQRARLSLAGWSASDGFGSPTLSTVVGTSLLARAAAIGVLLMLKPAPHDGATISAECSRSRSSGVALLSKARTATQMT